MGLTTYQQTNQRERVIALWKLSGTNATCTEIQRALGREGITTTRQTVRRTIDRWKLLGSVYDRARSGRPKALPDEHYKYIDHLLSENDELTAKDLIEHMTTKFGPVTYSERTMARALRLDIFNCSILSGYKRTEQTETTCMVPRSLKGGREI